MTVNTLLILFLCLANVLAVIVVLSGDVFFIRNNPSYKNRTTYFMLAMSYLLWQMIVSGVIAYMYYVARNHWWGIQILEAAALSYFAIKIIAFLCEVLDFQTNQTTAYRL